MADSPSCVLQLFLSDPETKFSKSIGWNLGERTARYALIIDHGKVVYAEKEPGRDVTVSTNLAVIHKRSCCLNPLPRGKLGFTLNSSASSI